MSLKQVALDRLIKPAPPKRAGVRTLPILSMTMHEGLVDQASKFKKRVASTDTANYKVVYRNQLVVGFPIDEGVLSFQDLYDEAIVSPAYDVWDLKLEYEVDHGYLERFLRSPRALTFYRSKLRGTTARRRSLPDDIFLTLEVPLPSRLDQQRVSKAMDWAEGLLAKRHTSLEKLENLTRATFIDQFGDPATNPKGWPRAILSDLIAKGPQNGLYRPSSDYGSGTPILRIDAFYDGKVTKLDSLKRVRISDAEKDLYKLFAGEIVVNRVNSMEYLGKSALIPDLPEPIVFESNMMRLEVDRNSVEPKYLMQFLQTRFIKKQILTAAKHAVNQSSINQHDVKNFQINVPPLPLQREFAQRFGVIERLKATHRIALVTLDALFAALQNRAFRGEL